MCWKDVIRHCIDLVSHPFSSFLLLCPVRWTRIRSMFIERTFEKRNSLTSRGEREKESIFFSSINTKGKERREEKIFSIFAWVSFNHDQMYITSLFWRTWTLYFKPNIGLVWARAFLRIVRDSWHGEGHSREYICQCWTSFELNSFFCRRTPRRKLVFSSSDDETDDSPQTISSGKIFTKMSIAKFLSFSASDSSTRTSFDLSRWTVSVVFLLH